jgi:putative oxidoreductase
MKWLALFRKYSGENQPFALNLFRIALGLVIFYKGILFVQDTEALNLIIEKSRIGGFAFILEHHVAFTLLVGGVLIALGLITRIAVLFQFPVFLGVILNQHANYGLYAVYSELGFAVVITFFLIAFLILGSGRFSVDYAMRCSRKQELAS